MECLCCLLHLSHKSLLASTQSQKIQHNFGTVNMDIWGLKTLQHKEMVHGLPQLKTPTNVCKDCLVGKQHRDSFSQKSTWRASHILQLVHADIYGPIKPTSNSKKRYLIIFIDDFSRKAWVYFLIEKSEAFVTFKKFKSLVEKATGSNINALIVEENSHKTSSLIFVVKMVYVDS